MLIQSCFYRRQYATQTNSFHRLKALEIIRPAVGLGVCQCILNLFKYLQKVM